MQKKTLSQIISNFSYQSNSDLSAINILVEGIQYDSRNVENNQIFVALSGGNFDGHDFIPTAIKNGAIAIIGTQDKDKWSHLEIPYIQVENGREALAYCSASFYDFPSHSMVLIGVTGTDGKTTTSNFIYQILHTAGLKVGIISTVNAQIGDEVLDTGFHVTTPEAPAVQYYLWKMKEAGMTHVILETTSHGLAQYRVAGCEFDIAVVTNITHEHLDFHGSYQSYLQAKGKLFEYLHETSPKSFFPNRIAVLNKDDNSFAYLNQITKSRQVHYSKEQKSELYADEITHSSEGIWFTVNGENYAVRVHSNIPGDFNVSNVLAAMAATIIGVGIDPQVAAEGIENVKSVPGRMEQIQMGQPFQAIVDFAHTPNALENAINTVRKTTNGRVITIFGSAGLRDRQKRRMMAESSAKLADITIITAEDPRTESLDDILQEMRKSAEAVGAIFGKNLFIEPDRGQAIALGIQLAKADDVVMACGKGHEQSMCFGETEYLWDDRTAMRAALARHLQVKGPEMPYLPTQN